MNEKQVKNNRKGGIVKIERKKRMKLKREKRKRK